MTDAVVEFGKIDEHSVYIFIPLSVLLGYGIEKKHSVFCSISLSEAQGILWE